MDGERSGPVGAIAAAELARRVAGRYGAPSGSELRSWLLAEQLAEPTPDGLRPTARGLELGAGLAESLAIIR